MTEDEFRTMLKENILKYQLSHRDVAHICGTSIPTVTRWVTGASAPHRFMFPAVKRFFEEECLS